MAQHGQGFTIVEPDRIERAGKWSLVRRSLGLTSFGMNLVEIEPGGDIPEHEETGRDQEEVFVVLDGSPTLVIDGAKYRTRPGTYARLDPDCRRTVVNEGDATATLLIVSAPRTSGYEPMEWA